MKSYPSITTKLRDDLPIHAFDKLDGSQIRAEWTKKGGLTGFGTRKRGLDASHPWLGQAIELTRDKYGAAASRVFAARKVQQAVLYLEFLGPGSFAGRHVEEPHDVVLFDVATFGRGLAPPDEFLAMFGDLDTPRLLYQGPPGRDFVAAVRAGTLPGLSGEGVICKATRPERRAPVMFKIKTRAWLDRVRALCAGDEALFAELS